MRIDYQPNQTIPGSVYRVIGHLGAGGMGNVYEVEDTTVGKRYVLKTLHSALRDRKELAVRMTKEARTLARLSHANIVEVVTAGVTTDDLRLPYFVMQKLSGHTLRQILNQKARLVIETAYSIAIDLLDALDHAHALGVIHRDVKPENIFIHRNPNGTHVTKLLDFGVMRMASGEQAETGHRFVGTLRYAPPEQLRGGAVTTRTDLYAAGLVLYEMIAGAGPFDAEKSDKAIAQAHLEKTPPRLGARAVVPEALDELMASALAKNPDDRPKDAFTFASKLRSLARDLSVARGPNASQAGTVEMVLSQFDGSPVITNVDTAGPRTVPLTGAPTRESSAPVRAQGSTLRDAEPPAQSPDTTLRMEVAGRIDRQASTRTMDPMDDAAADADAKPASTTGGSISSQAEPSALEEPRRGRSVTWLVAAMVAAGLVAALMIVRRAKNHDASHPPPAVLASPSVTATPVASSSAPVPVPAPTMEPAPPVSATAAIVSPPPQKPRAPARKPSKPAPAPATSKPLPGPGF